MNRQPNHRLAALLAEVGWSHAGLAKRVNSACQTRGSSRCYTATSVANWLAGMMPKAPVPEALAQLFTERLKRPIALRDLGIDEDVPLGLGLVWEATTRATVDTVAKLWKADMERRAVLLSSAWIMTAFATPTREWLLDWFDEDASRGGGRRVGRAEVEVVWSMCHAFADADKRLGGGYARTTLIHYVNQVVVPLLQGTYPENIGRLLLAAAARLCDIGGFMAFDSGAQGLGQRYYIQALRLAQASRDATLGAHILADMAMQAHYAGDGSEACSLARAGQQAARTSGSYSTLARCCAIEARAHAQRHDGKWCGDAMSRAETALERVSADDEPSWIRFFSLQQLHAEFAYASAELGQAKDVQRFVPTVLASPTGMERRRVLVTAVLASSYLGHEERGHPANDVEQACATLNEIVPLLGALTTARGIEAVNAVRRQLQPHADQEPVRELENRFHPLIGAAA